MTGFTPDQWLIVALIFLLGLILGMYLLAGGKWKRRYKEEVRLHNEERKRREALEKDNERLTSEDRRGDAQRMAAARSEQGDADRLDAERREADRREADRRVADRRDPS